MSNRARHNRNLQRQSRQEKPEMNPEAPPSIPPKPRLSAIAGPAGKRSILRTSTTPTGPSIAPSTCLQNSIPHSGLRFSLRQPLYGGLIPTAIKTPPPFPSPMSRPGVAFVLGLIPGVGAIYNGQYAKGLIHVFILGMLFTIVGSNDVGGFEPLFGVLIPGLLGLHGL